MPTVTLNGPPRLRRTPPGTGACVGRMTLDPGVTAFCFSSCRPAETALDVSLKSQQQGMMSFCLFEALASLRNRCTYEQWFEKAAVIMDDVREKYIPMMDQHMQLLYAPDGLPSEVVVFDTRYAGVAEHRLNLRRGVAPS